MAKENSRRGTEAIATILLTSEAMKILRSMTNKENLNRQLPLPVCPAGKFPPDPNAAGELNAKDTSRAQHQATTMPEFCC